jgi:arylsulfatase A-like enzyme
MSTRRTSRSGADLSPGGPVQRRPGWSLPLKRRDFLQASLVSALSAAGMGCGPGVRPPGRPGDHPNVLFIVFDDLNDWVGCLGGHPDASTPNIDRLARMGTLFTRAYTPSPLCNPSRVSTLTGLRPSTTGIYTNEQDRVRIIPGAPLLSGDFRTAGYRLEGGGKILHAGALPHRLEALPWWACGWLLADRWGPWDDFYFKRRSPRPVQRPVHGIADRPYLDWAGLDDPESQMADDRLAEWVSGRLRAPRDRPLFLGCGFFAPHGPWYIPRRYFERFRDRPPALPQIAEDDLEDVPAIARGWADDRHWYRTSLERGFFADVVAAYLAAVSYADACLGKVLEALYESPAANDTLVVLWSDHGWHIGEKTHIGKETLWEESARVPLILAGPGVGRPGTPCARTVSLTDLFPTLFQLCGLPPREGLDGVSFAELVADPERHWSRPALTTFEPGNHSVRSERWRYTRYSDGGEELYDHERDPGEWTNLAQRPEVASVKQDLARWIPTESSEPGS